MEEYKEAGVVKGGESKLSNISLEGELTLCASSHSHLSSRGSQLQPRRLRKPYQSTAVGSSLSRVTAAAGGGRRGRPRLVGHLPS